MKPFLVVALSVIALGAAAPLARHDGSNEITRPQEVGPPGCSAARASDMGPGFTAAMTDDLATTDVNLSAALSGDVDHVLCMTADATCEVPEVPRPQGPIATIAKRSGRAWGKAHAPRLRHVRGDVRLALAVRATGVRLNC